MDSVYTFSRNESASTNYYSFPQGFSPEELEKVSKQVSTLPFQEATTAHNRKNDVRTSSIKWIPQTPEWEWLYQKMMQLAEIANENTWGFDLVSAPEWIQYTEYYGTNNGKYDWHQDIGPGMLSKRKVSITVQLSDSDEYEGGDLEIWSGGDNVIKCPRGKGEVVLFPSYMMHRVAPVTSGTRKSFVLWVGGEHYR